MRHWRGGVDVRSIAPTIAESESYGGTGEEF